MKSQNTRHDSLQPNRIGDMEVTSLANRFLVAMPGMGDPNFESTVTYVCSHGQEGAMGIVVNRPVEGLLLEEVFTQLDIAASNQEAGSWAICQGGPVQTERGFVLHQPMSSWDHSTQISEEMEITTSCDILRAIASGSGPQHALVALGYAGWGGGQLEQELAENVWLDIPFNSRLLFDVPFEKRWKFAVESIGIQVGNLSLRAGSA